MTKVTFIKLPSVMARTCLSRSSIYSKIQKGEFPSPVKLGPRASAWVETEVDVWLEQRIECRDHVMEER